jgi:hypothetical protein
MTAVMVYTLIDLRIGFDVALSTDPEPNRASFTIANLSADTRTAIESAIGVRFSAGYGSELALIFSGVPIAVRNKRESIGWVAEIEALDGHDKIKESHFDKSFTAGTPLQTIVAAVAASFGIPFELGFIPANDTIMVGTTYSGSVFSVLNDLAAQLNLKWSIQGGVLQVSDKNAPVISSATQVVILAPDTGLIGSPVVSIDEDPKENEPIGSIDAVSLLNPLLLPDHPVKIAPTSPMTFAGVKLNNSKKTGAFSVAANGIYRIQRSRFTGCNKDGGFHTEITCPIWG